jgi:hypothetical protein
VVDAMRRAVGRARTRLAGVIPAAALDELAPSLRAAAERGVAVDLVTDAELPDGARIGVRRRGAGGPDRDRLGLVVGDGQETVLVDFGHDRPEGMWTHHPAVALLAAEHLRTLN